MASTNFCPLKEKGDYRECDKTDCAWWFVNEDGNGYCVVHRIGGALEDIHEVLDYMNYLSTNSGYEH